MKDERMTIRIPEELKTKVENLAIRLNVSTNDVIKFILFEFFDN